MVDFRVLCLFVSIFQGSTASEYSDCARLCKECIECITPSRITGKFGDYEAFIGIPYAAPPVGDLRFKDPQPPTTYPDTLTIEDKPKCLQRNLYTWQSKVEGDEDCLYLNVYRPVGLAHTLPVLLYFPHSDFMYGTGARSEIAPDIILNAGSIIVVVAQFRVGLMGFFSTGDEHAPGNMGLKDQEMAINWVLDQGPSFNCDIDQFTVYGDASVIYHMIRPDFFFDRAIISGSYPLSYFPKGAAFSQEEAGATAKRLAIALGYGDIPTVKLVEKMRTENSDVLMDRMVDLMGDLYFPFHLFGPTIEPESRTAFITESPEELWQQWDGDIPIMIGYSPYYGEQMVKGLEEVKYTSPIDTREAVKRLVQLEPYAYDRLDDIIKRYDLKVMDEFHITQQYRHNYVDMMTDRYYAQPLNQLIFWYNKNRQQKNKQLYLYRIMFDAPYNDGEVPYLFHNYENDNIYNFDGNEEFLTLMRDFIEEGIPRLETCILEDEHNSGALCPHVDFYHDFLYDEDVWNTTATDFWNHL